MTIQEALEIIKNEMPYESGVINKALSMIENAVEKQIPKKPIVKSYFCHYVNYQDFLCPYCRNHIILKVDGNFIAGKEQQYCDNCGQKIDWSKQNG